MVDLSFDAAVPARGSALIEGLPVDERLIGVAVLGRHPSELRDALAGRRLTGAHRPEICLTPWGPPTVLETAARSAELREVATGFGELVADGLGTGVDRKDSSPARGQRCNKAFERVDPCAGAGRVLGSGVLGVPGEVEVISGSPPA